MHAAIQTNPPGYFLRALQGDRKRYIYIYVFFGVELEEVPYMLQ